MARRAGALVLAVMLVAAARPAGAHPSPAQPYDRARIVQGLTGALWTSVQAHWPAGATLPDPGRVGLRVHLTIEPGGTQSTLDLPASDWESGQDHRFTATGCDGRVIRARLRTGRHGGRFTLHVPDCTAPWVPPDATRVALLVASGDVRWCADMTLLQPRKRRVSGRTTTALTTCPCESLPADTFVAIERRIFARHGCGVLGCHGGAAGQADLSLSPGLAYPNLVGVPSIMDPPRLRVAPGDPAASLLWRKLAVRTLGLDGVPGLGMPIGDPPLDSNELEAVRLWIAAGAPATGTIPQAQVLLDCMP